jgi:hypothetical protein
VSAVVPELRQAYNAAFTEERYRALVADLTAAAGVPADFRISETPLFLSAPFAEELARAAEEIVAQVQTDEYKEAAILALPREHEVPNEDARTTFLQVDFGICRGDDGRPAPRLIELQGFPSLYGFQWFLERAFREHFPIPSGLTSYFGGLDGETYVQALRRAIVADSDPRNVVLLEIEPEKQKTRIDFACTEKLLGIPTVDAAKVRRRGRRLFYEADGVETPIDGIYNRVIFDEVARKGIDLSEIFRSDLDVRWIGHPNWYFRISKFSLPLIESRYSPPCHFLTELDDYPPDLENYVLKPIFSFAGHGVEIGLTRERLDAIPDPENFILQRKVEYAPIVETPDGYSKAEIRMMFLRRAGRLELVNNLVRMSKGEMMGVSFNRDKTWVGSSLAFHP